MATAISANRAELIAIANSVASEKMIDKAIVIEAMEDAIQRAARARYGAENDIRAKLDPDTGDLRLWRVVEVVETVEDYFKQVDLKQGQKLHFAYAERLMETRMYHGLAHLIEGWSKNIYLGGRRSFPDEPVLRSLVPAMLIVAMVFWLIPPAALAGSALSPALAALVPAALLATGLAAVFWILICLGMQIPMYYGLGYPLGALMALYIVLRSSWRGGRRVEWRGRVYQEKRERDKGERKR